MTTNNEHNSAFDRACHHAKKFRETLNKRLPHKTDHINDLLSTFGEPTPEKGMPGAEIIDHLAEISEPGLLHSSGSRFFAWVTGSSNPVGVAADWLTSAWGQNCANVDCAPSGSAVEAVASRWLLDLLHLPEECSVGFVSGDTMANFVCLAAARGELLHKAGWDVDRDGLFGAPNIRIIIGDEAHATVFQALQYLGFGYGRVTKIAVDDAGRMLVEDFKEKLSQSDDPTIVLLQAGQINTGAFDPFTEIIEAAHKNNAWVHVDGAFGLWARACPERKALTEGVDMADSWAVDGHKWLQTPYSSGFAIMRNSAAHRKAMTIAASYLPAYGDEIREPTHYVPELSRRATGFATWAVIKNLGREGIAEMVERHCQLASHMADRLAQVDGVEVLNPVELNQFTLRFGNTDTDEEKDTLTTEVISRVLDEGTCYMNGGQWHGHKVMRVSIISAPTTEDDADASVESVIRAWKAVQNSR
ncbi:MAG: aspartate aminotransferase family protein [Rhodospirillales bacterium]|jgi:glutamate/tyrosine decarboxylase-like PLP-dependent enzyme|nr:aspartate aminotransferase family protein [Rhodospirillales bacterium]